MDKLLTQVAGSLGLSAEEQQVEISKWKKVLGTHCTTLEHLKELLNDKASWDRIAQQLEPIVEKRIRDYIPQYEEGDFFPATMNPQKKAVIFWKIIVIGRAVLESCNLNLFDVIQQLGPSNAAAIAAKLGTVEYITFRILRLLASFDILKESSTGVFSLTSVGEVLTDNHPLSQKGYVKSAAIWWQLLTPLQEELKTGNEGPLIVYKKPMWQHFNENPDIKKLFGEAMMSMSKPEIPGILQAYSWANYKKIVDVGGSMGHVLKAILRDPRYQHVHGVNFDLPHVVDLAKSLLSQEGYDYKNRLEMVGGDYTKEIPKGDCYLIKYCIHNAKGEQTPIDILNACHRASEPNGKLCLIEIVLSEVGDVGGRWDKCMDILMFVLLNARERTLSEYKELGLKTGWKLNRAVPVPGSTYSLHVIEFDKIN